MKWCWLLILFLFLALFQLLQIVDLNRSVKDLSVSKQLIYQQKKMLEREIEDNEKIIKMQHWFEGVQIDNMLLGDFYSKDTVSLVTIQPKYQ